MRSYAIYRTMIFAGLLLSVAGCQSDNATSCAGFRKNNLTPAGLVALTKADRAGAERVEGNDEKWVAMEARIDARFSGLESFNKNIQSTLSRINWMVIGALVAAVMTFIVAGGLNKI